MNFILLWGIILFGKPKDTAIWLLLTLGLCLVSGIFIVFDLTVILIPGVADKEDYILHALGLYLDVVRLFVNLLILLSDN